MRENTPKTQNKQICLR